MIRFKNFKVQVVLALVCVLYGCRKDTGNSNLIIGQWQCPLIGENFKGTEYLNFEKDHRFSIKDSIIYSLSDDKVSLTIGYVIVNSGKWDFNNDLLSISVNELSISPDTSSIMVECVDPRLKLDSGSHDYHNFRLHVLEAVRQDLTGVFSVRSDTILELGKVTSLTKTHMTIKSDISTLNLTQYTHRH